MKSPLGWAGRILFALPLLVFGSMHLMNSGAMAGMVLAGWPMAQVLVIFTGLAMVAAAVSILSLKHTRLAAMLLGAMFLVFVVSVHIPGMMAAQDDNARMMPMMGLLKDTMLAGGAFLMSILAGKA